MKLLTIVGIFFLVIGAVTVIFAIASGKDRYTEDVMARFVGNIVAGIIAVFVTPIVLNIVRVKFGDRIIALIPEGLIGDEALLELGISIVFAATGIILFALLYLILYLLFRIPGTIYSKQYEEKENQSLPVCILVSAFSCAFTLYLLFSPFYCVVYSVAADASVILKTEPQYPEARNVISNLIVGMDGFGTVEEVDNLGKRRNFLNSFVYDRVATFKYTDGTTTGIHKIMNETVTALSSVLEAIPADFAPGANKTTVDVVRVAKNQFLGATFLRVIISDIVRGASKAWCNGEDYVLIGSVSNPFLDTDFEETANKYFEILKDANDDEIVTAMDSALNALESFIEGYDD